MDEVILVKGDQIFPGADAYIPKNNSRRCHLFGHSQIRDSKSIGDVAPQNIQEVKNIPKGQKVRLFTEMETSLDTRRGNRGAQCPASKFNMYEEHKNFV